MQCCFRLQDTIHMQHQQWGCDGEVTLRIRTWNMKDIFLALSKPSSVNFLGPELLIS